MSKKILFLMGIFLFPCLILFGCTENSSGYFSVSQTESPVITKTDSDLLQEEVVDFPPLSDSLISFDEIADVLFPVVDGTRTHLNGCAPDGILDQVSIPLNSAKGLGVVYLFSPKSGKLFFSYCLHEKNQRGALEDILSYFMVLQTDYRDSRTFLAQSHWTGTVLYCGEFRNIVEHHMLNGELVSVQEFSDLEQTVFSGDLCGNLWDGDLSLLVPYNVLREENNFQKFFDEYGVDF